MSPPKSPLLTETKVPCLSCGRECPDGLRYCLYCGGKTLEIDKPAMPMNVHCPQCNEEDELNIFFCVLCGTKLLSLEAKPTTAATAANATAPKFTRKTGFNWTVEDTPPPAVRMAMRSVDTAPRPVVRVADKSSSLVPLMLGSVCGLLLAGMLFLNGFVPYALARLTWPKGGLVVYCPPGDSSGMQLSLENLESHVLTVAPVRAPGAVLGQRSPGFVVLKDLPAGNYMLRVQKYGSPTAFGLVTLAPQRPTVIGYPNGVQLPSEPKE